MQKFMGMLGVLMLSATLTFAQQGQNRTPEERAQRQTEQLTKQLSLSADQTTKVQALSLERAKKMEELRAGGERPDREKLQALQTDFDTKLKPVLTADQWTQYEKFREEQRERMRNRGGNR